MREADSLRERYKKISEQYLKYNKIILERYSSKEYRVITTSYPLGYSKTISAMCQKDPDVNEFYKLHVERKTIQKKAEKKAIVLF